jgi:hypothetical protein
MVVTSVNLSINDLAVRQIEKYPNNEINAEISVQIAIIVNYTDPRRNSFLSPIKKLVHFGNLGIPTQTLHLPNRILIYIFLHVSI